MLTTPVLGLIGVTVLATSFLSGIFGMAGGLILLGVLLMFMDVAPAMVLFGVIQMSANGWRALLWRVHVRWGIVWRFVLGASAVFLALRTVLASRLMPRAPIPAITVSIAALASARALASFTALLIAARGGL